jgi:hypothetical protein
MPSLPSVAAVMINPDRIGPSKPVTPNTPTSESLRFRTPKEVSTAGRNISQEKAKAMRK